MSSGKPNVSDSSGEEIDQPEKQTDGNTGVGRSYECSFCKRGFTNAQALGGHMNIHRKDKAKAKTKQKNQDSPKAHEEFTNQKYLAEVSSEQRLYSSSLGSYMSYELYFPGPNPSYLHAYDRFDLGSTRKDRRTLHEYRRVDQSLSLKIGPSCLEDVGERKNNMIEADIDLELRLGQHP